MEVVRAPALYRFLYIKEVIVEIAQLLQFLYAYFALLASSIVLFELAYRYPLQRPERNLFEMYEVIDDAGKSRPVLSGLASGLLLIGVMILGITALHFLSQYLEAGIFTTLFVGYITFVAILVVTNFRLHRFPFFAKRRVLNIFVNWLLACAIGIGWYAFPSWQTYDFTFLMIMYAVIATMGGVKLRTFFIVFPLMIGFDVWGVFISKFIVQVALEMPIRPPLLLIIPAHPFSWSMMAIKGLGSGDIMIAGIAVVTAARYGIRHYVYAGYAVGLLAVLFLVTIYNMPMPALITLVPAILASFLIGYYKKRHATVTV